MQGYSWFLLFKWVKSINKYFKLSLCVQWFIDAFLKLRNFDFAYYYSETDILNICIHSAFC